MKKRPVFEIELMQFLEKACADVAAYYPDVDENARYQLLTGYILGHVKGSVALPGWSPFGSWGKK